MSKNPLRSFLDVRKQERPLAVLMFFYFFLVIATFWVLKPIKKTIFINYYSPDGNDGVNRAFELFGTSMSGSEAEQIAKVMNMVVAFFAVVVFSWLARNLRRQQLTYVFAGFCVAALGLFYFMPNDSEVSVWAFYLFGDLYNTLMVATFFAFLNDSFTPSAAKRAYGPIILGGVVGGAFGSMGVRAWIDNLSFNQWVLIAIGMCVAMAVVAWAAGVQVAKNPPPEDIDDRLEAEKPDKKESNPAIAGAKLVAGSKYLLAIVAIVATYEIVSTILDFQWTKTFELMIADDGERNAAFATTYAISNGLALFVQLFLTSFVMTRFGVRTALLILPIVVIGASSGFLIFPMIYLGASLSISDNGLNYAINQSARESLYTVTSKREKYQAKAFIDMFVQRFAKALAVGLNLLLSMVFADMAGLRWLSVIAIVCTGAWLLSAWYVGGRFKERAAEREKT